MINITEKIYSKVKSIMDTWSEADIYAIWDDLEFVTTNPGFYISSVATNV